LAHASRRAAKVSRLSPLSGRRHGGALELADLEETEQEDPQPAPDGRKVTGPLIHFPKADRPSAGFRVAPGIPGEIGDLAGPQAVARQVEEVEILQRIRADELLGALAGRIAVARHELGRDLGREHCAQGHRFRQTPGDRPPSGIRCWISVFDTEPFFASENVSCLDLWVERLTRTIWALRSRGDILS
jgi:hypothetical protein